MMFDQAEKRNDDKADRARASVSGGQEVRKSHWTQGLLSSMNDPEFVLHSTTDLVIIRDKYPKSTHHLLVIPKKPIDSINNLVQEDVSLLEQMEDEATKFVTKKFGESEFLMGYHAVPSMSQLHLHVISRDFVSDCLKHKKHWNSFTTGYFLSSSSVIKQVKEAGSVRTMSQQEARHLLTLPLQCNQCPHLPKNIPDLKRHLKEHFDMRSNAM